MLKTLVRIVLINSVLAMSLFANDIPIQEKMEINIPINKWSILEFPFKIKDKTFTAFKRKVVKIEKKEKKINKPELKKPQSIVVNGKELQVAAKPKKEVVENKKSLHVDGSENIIRFLPKNEGSLEMVLWGYDEFPIIFTINTVAEEDSPSEDMQQYFRFKDYKIEDKKAITFETDTHYKILEKLLKALFTEEIPRGFKQKITKKFFNNQLIQMNSLFSYVGYNYIGETWLVTNISPERINLYEEMFSQKGVFLISLESDYLNTGDSARVWIISKKDK